MLFHFLLEFIAWFFGKRRDTPPQIPQGLSAEEEASYTAWWREHVPPGLTTEQDAEYIKFLREEQGIEWPSKKEKHLK